MLVKLLTIIAIVLMLPFQSVFAAEEDTVTGVVSSVSAAKQFITIRNETSGQRRTYFIADDTRLTSNGQPINLSQIRAGNTVSLRYRTTDLGREIVSVRVPEPASITDVAAVDSTEVRTISGVVTGVRPSKRTLTIRDDATRDRRTLILPDDVRISREGSPITINRISKGDLITARYRTTDQGLIIVSSRSTAASEGSQTQTPATETPSLPKTAGNLFVFLFLSLALFMLAGVVRLYKTRKDS